ncbi:putative major pilin subunit [Anaerohalosphaera lusitana]|uniref:Putative major pilin subunit n=1 Tax=Anaerohalosphaera lusitana TaxID=1936003 RepID=A0A1U9NLH4_9BACT|nr:prepilin-type N-terminal cleavage/methylation domain-containing protein [Anaerohalosphaera lusitana]AQT68759.1 putative major pilin subunit [Anaerohalosphaera lusitana]
MKKKGFTLIELLVVISIIALLLAIMMPALGKVKELAKSTVCGSNAKTMVTAWRLYAEDNDGQMCSSWTYDTRHGWGNTWDWVWAPYELDGSGSADEFDATEKERREGIKRGAIYSYCSDADAFHCPSDKRTNNQQGNAKFRTYSIPDSLGGPEGYYPWRVFTKISQVKQPSRKYAIVEENDSRGYNMNSWILFPDESSPNGFSTTAWCDPYLSAFHNDSSTFAYVDGHVDSRKWSRETIEYLDTPQSEFNNAWGSKVPSTDAGKDDLIWLTNGWAK